MKMYKKTFAMLSIAALALTACSDPGTPGGAPATSGDGGEQVSTQWPDATANLDGVALTIWAAQSSNTIPASVAQSFEEATGANVEIITIPDGYEQNLQTKVATGDVPDLAMWQPTTSMLTSIGAEERLQSLNGAPWEDNYAEGILDYGGDLNGTRFAAFVSAPSTMGVWYNKRIFEEQGADIPQNFDDLLTTARTMRDAGQTPLYEMGGEWWATQWTVQVLFADAAANGMWDRVNTNKEGFTGSDIQGAIDDYAAMIDEGLYNDNIKTATFNEQAQALLNGEAAMAIASNSLLANMASLADTQKLNDTIGFFPISKAGTLATSLPEQTNAVVAFRTGDAERESAAKQFLTYWLSDAYEAFVTEQNTVSIIDGVETPDAVTAAAVEANEALQNSVGSMQSLAIANPDLAMNLGDMIAGTKTPQEVSEATQAQFVELAQAMGAEGF